MKYRVPQPWASSPAWKLLLLRAFPLEAETAMFVIASTLDVCMTYALLTHPEVDFVESNPLARYFLYGWGLSGMVMFKYVMVAFIAATCQVIARTRLDVARRVMHFAIGSASLVIVYSLALLYHATFAG